MRITVEDLREYLKEYPSDATVAFLGQDGEYYNYGHISIIFFQAHTAALLVPYYEGDTL